MDKSKAKFKKYLWRFYADNNMENKVVDYLRILNFNIIWTKENPKLSRQDDLNFHYQKARQLDCSLLTRNAAFWNDNKYSMKESPGVLVLDTEDMGLILKLPDILKKLILKCNSLRGPLYLDGIKMKLGSKGVVIKILDRNTQKKEKLIWLWKDFPKLNN
jgi:hypothetical protein